MKHRMLAILLMLLTLWLALPAGAESAPSQTLQGLITEVGTDYFVMEDQAIGTVHVKLDDTVTVYDGIAVKGKLTVGLYVFVQYNGILTKSIPPQATAQKVGCYVVRGSVGEILQNGYLVKGDTVLGDVIVHMGENMPSVYSGVAITVYYNGVMALSMPPQINAAYLLVPMLDGVASAVTDQGFTLTDANGETHAITLNANTRVLTVPAEAAHVRVYLPTQPQSGSTGIALEVSALGDDGKPAEVVRD